MIFKRLEKQKKNWIKLAAFIMNNESTKEFKVQQKITKYSEIQANISLAIIKVSMITDSSLN